MLAHKLKKKIVDNILLVIMTKSRVKMKTTKPLVLRFITHTITVTCVNPALCTVVAKSFVPEMQNTTLQPFQARC